MRSMTVLADLIATLTIAFGFRSVLSISSGRAPVLGDKCLVCDTAEQGAEAIYLAIRRQSRFVF